MSFNVYSRFSEKFFSLHRDLLVTTEQHLNLIQLKRSLVTSYLRALTLISGAWITRYTVRIT